MAAFDHSKQWDSRLHSLLHESEKKISTCFTFTWNDVVLNSKLCSPAYEIHTSTINSSACRPGRKHHYVICIHQNASEMIAKFALYIVGDFETVTIGKYNSEDLILPLCYMREKAIKSR